MTRYLLALLPVLFIFGGCSQTQSVTLPVLNPAPLHVDNHIQRVAVIDRITPERALLSRAESLLTGGAPGLDNEAGQRALDGLVHTLEASPRFDVIRTTESLSTPILRGNWPDPLGWDIAQALCEEYECDAILSLETLNSDFIITDGTRVVERENEDGETVEETEFFAEGLAQIKLGFRLYDPAERSIVDAHMFDHNASWSASGSTLQDALSHLVNHREAVINTSYESGEVYASRITPQWITVRRQFFSSGDDEDFQRGVRRAQVDDWQGAIDAWHRSVESEDPKIAGRSAFNLALMYEIEGDLERAKEWAQTAYVEYEESRARRYVATLEDRIERQRRTDAQLSD